MRRSLHDKMSAAMIAMGTLWSLDSNAVSTRRFQGAELGRGGLRGARTDEQSRCSARSEVTRRICQTIGTRWTWIETSGGEAGVACLGQMMMDDDVGHSGRHVDTWTGKARTDTESDSVGQRRTADGRRRGRDSAGSSRTRGRALWRRRMVTAARLEGGEGRGTRDEGRGGRAQT